MKIKYLVFPILITTILLCSCNEKKQNASQNNDSIPVTGMKVMKKKILTEISVSGNMEGTRTVRLGFMVPGKIKTIVSKEGRKITQNQLVASLDSESYAIAKELADIQVSQVQDEYNRLKGMYDSKSISEADFAKIGYGLRQAKAQQKIHAKNLAETKLYSPISGVLIKKLAETGEITGTGIPILVISDIRTVKAVCFVPENELHLVNTGQFALVKVSSLDSTFTGRITEIGSLADPASRAFTVKIEIPNPRMIIRPGMIAEVKLPAGETEEVLEVPVESVLHDFNNQSYVFVFDESAGKAFKRSVSLGHIHNDQIEIISGIKEGEIMITGGHQKLTDGSTVSITK